MAQLAKRHDGRTITRLDELAQREAVSANFLVQILNDLRRAGLVESRRGKSGGYMLARPAEEISIRAVIHASELETFDLHCVSHPVETDRCSASHNCSIRPVWVLLQTKIDDVLESVCLADLLHDEPQVRERVGLPILETV